MRPIIQTEGSAGADLTCNIDRVVIYPGEWGSIPTGYMYDVNKPGYVGLVKGRSSLAFKRHVFAYEGTIDSDYGDEVMVLLKNDGKETATFWFGDRIGQLVIVPELTGKFFDTVPAKRVGGFGSTDETVDEVRY